MAASRNISIRSIAVGPGRLLSACLAGAFLLSSCTEIQRPKVEPFFAVTGPPPKQELRWSNGKIPKTLDPARAAAPPETDLIRAVYDGLTDLDSKTLRAVPAVAEKWEASENFKIWTFTLRRDAKWSNGERVTAGDFVRSWKRLAELREKAANRFLFQNIVGMSDRPETKGEPSSQPGDFLHAAPPGPESTPSIPASAIYPQSQLSAREPGPATKPAETEPIGRPTPSAPKFGVEAVNDSMLTVSLELPDKDFPKLVANPIFRPVFGDGSSLEKERLDTAAVTNGAFRITKITNDGITLEPAESHWDRRSLALESVKFVAAASPENALEAYKKGDVDVVTNAAFEPLALKLLAPYEDFRRTAHSALNFYEFNTSRAPFSDRRIREALTIAIDRTKLTEGDLEGMMQPANSFNLLSESKHELLSLDVEKAKQLLEKAGYPDGVGFPDIRLVVNRNDTQQRVARSVAKMWQQNLNIETQIIVKEASEIEAVRAAGDFDIVRRGIVLPTNDELVSLASIFGSARKPADTEPADIAAGEPRDQAKTQGPNPADESANTDAAKKAEAVDNMTMTEADAIFELRAIPLYFPTSYALVKPYVRGFEMNGLDAPSLKEISIDSSWQPKAPRTGQ